MAAVEGQTIWKGERSESGARLQPLNGCLELKRTLKEENASWSGVLSPERDNVTKR